MAITLVISNNKSVGMFNTLSILREFNSKYVMLCQCKALNPLINVYHFINEKKVFRYSIILKVN